jgi:hypothetical protein
LPKFGTSIELHHIQLLMFAVRAVGLANAMSTLTPRALACVF